MVASEIEKFFGVAKTSDHALEFTSAQLRNFVLNSTARLLPHPKVASYKLIVSADPPIRFQNTKSFIDCCTSAVV
jgi:hypothetical protein